MGRKLGTNVYSNNFEPQVMGLLDARTQVDTKADLTKDATWTSTDGNTYAPVGIRVSVTDDSTNGNNGVYMLMSEDYAIASNWMKIGSEGNAEFIMVDLSFVDAIPGTYTPDRYLMAEFIKIQDALSVDTPFFISQFANEFGQFPVSATIDGDIFELSILYRDEVWFVNFNGVQYTVSKGGTSPLTNVKVFTTSSLLNPGRDGTIYLSSSDTIIWKNLETSRDIVVYSGSFGTDRHFVPLSISSTGDGTLKTGRVTYMLNGSIYYFRIEYVNPSTYSAGAVTKKESSADKTIYLTTPTMLDPGWDTDLNQEDTDALKKLYTENNSSITNIVYVGTESGGNQFLVPLSCYSDFGGNSPMDVLFLHPWQQKVYHTVIDIFATPPIAYDPEEIIFNSGSSTNNPNIKVLSTAQLINPARTTNLQMSPDDVLAIRKSDSKSIFVYNSILGTNHVFVPMTLNAIGNTAELASIFELYYIFGSEMYVIKIKADGQNFSASPIQGILQAKQDVLKSGTNIKTINGNSILGQGNLVIEGGGASAAEIVELPTDASTNLPYENGYYDGNSQDFANKIREISNNPTKKYMLKYSPIGYYTIINPYRASIYLGFYVDTSDGVLHFYTTNDTNNDDYTIQSEGSYNLKQDNLVSGENIKTINGQSILGSGNIDISGGSGGSELHDLSIDVKAGPDGIYYRIREVVPNGYIHFVRKKKKKYYDITQDELFYQTTYSPMKLSFNSTNVGVSASKLTPNIWYKYPITNEELVNTYTAGSKNPEGVIVTYDMYKFSGNTHAKPIFFPPNGGTIGSKRTTVLNAGLQYNVLDSSFVSGKSAKTIFRQRGDIRKIDVRLSVNNINTFSSGYKLIYAIK